MEFTKLLKESQFHGGRRLPEKICRWYWYISMAVLFGSAVAVIIATVQRFFDNPTYIVYQEAVGTAVKFPSVLICPEIFYRPDKVDRFLAHVDIPTFLKASYIKEVAYMLAAFYSPDVLYKVHDLKNIESLLEFNNMQVDTAARLLTTSCDSTLIKCRWNGVMQNCSSLFHMELTGDGYCCVFNGQSLRDYSDEQHHDHLHDQYFVDRFGHESGLMLAVNQSQPPISVDLSYKWVAVQTPNHFVESTINGSALNRGSEFWLEYHFMNFQIGEEARNLRNSLKKCRMTNEALNFFPVYNKQYCAVECELANTLRKCSCLRLVHPRPPGKPYCKAHQLLCATHAMVSGDEDLCSCPAACDVATDFVKITSFTLQPHVHSIDTFYDGLDFDKVSIVRIFLMNSMVRTNSRWSYFSNTDLFSQLGGVFNVFFGCSILTLLELSILLFRGIASKRRTMSKSKVAPQNNRLENAKTALSKLNKKKKLKMNVLRP